MTGRKPKKCDALQTFPTFLMLRCRVFLVPYCLRWSSSLCVLRGSVSSVAFAVRATSTSLEVWIVGSEVLVIWPWAAGRAGTLVLLSGFLTSLWLYKFDLSIGDCRGQTRTGPGPKGHFLSLGRAARLSNNNERILCDIFGSLRSVAEDSSLVGCDPVPSRDFFLSFRRDLVPSSSG